MPSNSVDSTGLTIQTRQQIIDEILNGADGFLGLKAIYGADINVDPNTPDGNLVNLIAQAKVDVLEFIAQVFAGIDPDQAIGRVLDMRCAINGVARKAGTYTLQNVDITVTQALTLEGLDTAPLAPFTVADAAGNQFVLIAQHVFGAAGTATLAFRALELGAIITTANTITRFVTIQLGVGYANNPSVATSIGTNEESDYALRIRRAQSVSLPSKGYLQGLIGALVDIDAVTSAIVLENITNVVDANGIPGHSIWAIVDGGANADIAQAIYVKRNAGCGMKGGVSVNITQVDGSVFAVLFDRPVAENLWIKLNAVAITGPAVDNNFLRAQILAALSYQINQPADASAIVALAKTIYPNAAISAEGVSTDNVTYVALLNNTAVNKRWAMDTVRIYVNGAHG